MDANDAFRDWMTRTVGGAGSGWEDSFRALWSRRLLTDGLPSDRLTDVLNRRLAISRQTILTVPWSVFFRPAPDGGVVRVEQGVTRKGDIVQRRLPLPKDAPIPNRRTLWRDDFRTFGYDHAGPTAEAAVVLGAIPDGDRRALALLRHDGWAMRTNAGFRRLANAGEPFRLEDGRVRVASATRDRDFHALLREIAASPGRQETMMVAQTPPVFVSLRAVNSETGADLEPVLLVGPAMDEGAALAATLVRLFALTEREARTAVQFTQGRPIADIAGEEGVSTVAIRARLRRVKSCCAVTGDGALFDLLRRLAGVL